MGYEISVSQLSHQALVYQLVRGAWRVPGAAEELRRLTVKGSEGPH